MAIYEADNVCYLSGDFLRSWILVWIEFVVEFVEFVMPRRKFDSPRNKEKRILVKIVLNLEFESFYNSLKFSVFLH